LSKKEKLELFREFFGRVQAANARPGLIEKFERFITGSTFWCMWLRLEDRRLGKTLDQQGEHSFQTKRQRDRCERAELGCRYSQPLDRATETAIAGERFSPVPDRGIRVLVANRLLKQGGKYQASIAKERTLLATGWVFVILCVIAFGATAALIWASHGSLILKVLLTLGSFVVLLLLAYAMSYFAIKPYFLAKQLEQ